MTYRAFSFGKNRQKWNLHPKEQNTFHDVDILLTTLP